MNIKPNKASTRDYPKFARGGIVEKDIALEVEPGFSGGTDERGRWHDIPRAGSRFATEAESAGAPIPQPGPDDPTSTILKLAKSPFLGGRDQVQPDWQPDTPMGKRPGMATDPGLEGTPDKTPDNWRPNTSVRDYED